MIRVRHLWPLAVAGCAPALNESEPRPLPGDAAVFTSRLGEPAPIMGDGFRASFERGRAVLERRFQVTEGLGPAFNADSCVSCHQVPVGGGSAPRYRDFFLVQRERSDGVWVDAGTNGESPVLNLYVTPEEGHHQPPPHGLVVHARRNAPSGLGMGWLHFVPDEEILRREDPDDADGDGISGRANYEQGRVGRFGYKAQAFNLESFNRGAAFNQMGITTDPLRARFPEDPDPPDTRSVSRRVLDRLIAAAHAQVAAPDEPTFDRDDVPDPELSNEDQLDLLVFSTYLGAPEPRPLTSQAERGADVFHLVGCTSCHVPRLASTVGPIRAYTDLLLHDMGEELADGMAVGRASGREFRTAPLWGVTLHPPYLHDGRADTLDEAIRWHGGEGSAARDAYGDLSPEERADLLAFLESLSPVPETRQVLAEAGLDGPAVGDEGGPYRQLSESERVRWKNGRSLFDRTMVEADGLGADGFNADSCRACHQQPVLGGAGGSDVDVLRYDALDASGAPLGLPGGVLARSVLPGALPHRLSEEADVVVARQSPSLLGLGLLEAVDEAVILAGEDPEDADGDGIAGVARRLPDGRLGRFGWKAQIPSLKDFVYDALFQEMGITTNPASSPFAVGEDEDDVPDPEFADQDVLDITLYLELLGPPAPGEPGPLAARGERVFEQVGCAKCHVPDLGGVPAYTDLLVHEVVDQGARLVGQDDGVSPTAFRTPPLWGIGGTPPYLHDGRAPTLDAAIRGHGASATAVREAYEALPDADQRALIDFLRGL